MDIWMRVCRKKAKCSYCPKPIVKGQYMVVGKLWRKHGGEARVWTIYLRWHIGCWVRQGIESLKKRPVVENRGRKKLELSEDARKARLKITMRRAAIVQRIRREVDKPIEEQSIDRIIHLGEMLEKLATEIENFGGAPKSWS